MTLGNNLFHARKKSGMSQESVAEKLGISRQTVSKWESGETVPDIRQAKMMAKLYSTTLDELIEFDPDIQQIQEAIEMVPEKAVDKIDWTNAWSKKYPILIQYQSEVNTSYYALRLNQMLDELRQEYHYNEQDAVLVLKDILYKAWKARKK